MNSKRSDGGNVGFCHSCGSFRSFKGKTTVCQCRSMPAVRPNLSLSQRTTKWMHRLKAIFQASNTEHSQSKTASMDDCKSIIRELAMELERVLQYRSSSLFNSVREDSYSQKESQHFVLEWSEELRKQLRKDQQEASEKSYSPGTAEEKNSVEQKKPIDHRSPVQEERLKEAQQILRDWAKSLSSLPEGCAYHEKSVCADIKEMQRWWKKGKLSSILPVMDFIMWAVIQERPEEGAVPQLWLRTKQKSNKTVSLQHIPDSAWKWICEASVDFKLDPETANRDLTISKDRKSVKMDTIIEDFDSSRRDVPRSSHRYNGWWCVLGTVEFTAGRYYWEVGVTGKKEWRIGVVGKHAPRNGFLNLNTEAQYWTLRLQLGTLMALTVPITKLQSPIPSKVGVHLDLDEGQLSFYDVDRRCHIYTFTETFPQKVYAVFGTIETDHSLVLL